MAEKREDSMPDSVKTFFRRQKKVERLLAGVEYHHAKAYNAGVETLMKEGDEGPDFEKLKEAKNQEAFADAMANTYLDAAKKYFKVGKGPKDDHLWEQRLMKAYAGVTKDELLNRVRALKSDFNYEFFNQRIRPTYMKRVREELEPAIASHFKDEHIDDILKSIPGSEKVVDKSKLRLQEAVQLLDAYRVDKALSKRGLASIPDYAIKEKKYRSDYVEKAA